MLRDMVVKVLGPAGVKRDKLVQEVRRALRYVGLDATLSTTDSAEEASTYGQPETPALVINAELKVAGRIPDQAELTTWLTTAALKEEVS